MELNFGGQECVRQSGKEDGRNKGWRFEVACSGPKVNLMVQGAERVGRDETAKEAGLVLRNSLKTWI